MLEDRLIITLDDFPKEKTFVKLNKHNNLKLFRKAIKRAGSQRLLAYKIKNDLKYPKIRQTIISNMLKRDFHRLDLIRWLKEYTNSKLNLQKQIRFLKGEATSKPIKPVFPIEKPELLASILANLYCDGNTNARDGSVTSYNNKNINLINNFKCNLKKVFGLSQPSEFYYKKSDMIKINSPHFIGKLICNKFNINNDRIPKEILNNSKDSIKGAYLRAVFDDEGTISKKYGQIRLKMKYRSYVADVASLLNSIGIETSKLVREKPNVYGSECYYFTISGQANIKNFSEKVGFNHEKKAFRLRKAINSIKLENFGYQASKKVLDIIKNEGPQTSQAISSTLHRHKRTIHYHLERLFKKKLVSFKKVSKRYSYEYVWFIKNGVCTNNRRKA